MKAFQYKLASLLTVRQLQQEQREAEFAAAMQQRNLQQQALQSLEQQLQNVYAQEICPNVNAEFFLQRERYLYTLKQRRRRQQQRLAEAEAALAESRRRLQAAVMEVRKLEKHCQHERDAWALQFRREEDKINDEIGLTLNLRNQEARAI